jgi:hypothetical protein
MTGADTQPRAELGGIGRAVLWTQLTLGLFLVLVSVRYVWRGEGWAWSGAGAGALLVLIACFGLGRRLWVGPLYVALALLGAGALLGGVLDDDASFFLAGIGCFVVLGVTMPIAHLLTRIARALEARDGRA